MKVDFYQISRDPVERVVAMLAQKVLDSGQRLLVVSADAEQHKDMSRALWSAGPESFLANGSGLRSHADRQPILISDKVDAANGATMICLADGRWREEAMNFDRVLLLFGPDERDAAAAVWKTVGTHPGAERQIHKQDENGRWRAGS